MGVWPMDGGRDGTQRRSATTKASVTFSPTPRVAVFPSHSTPCDAPDVNDDVRGWCVSRSCTMATCLDDSRVADVKGRVMIYSTVEKRDDEFVLAISDEDMAAHGLRDGDRIMFHPVKIEDGRTELRPEIQEALERTWEQNEAGFRYLKDR